MKVKIKGTEKIESLSIIDKKSNEDWVHDFIGNTGAFCDEQFTYNEEFEMYEVDQEDFEWWHNVIKEKVAADEIYYAFLESLNDEDDKDYIKKIVSEICTCDLEDQSGAIIAVVKSLKEKQGRGLSPAEIEE